MWCIVYNGLAIILEANTCISHESHEKQPNDNNKIKVKNNYGKRRKDKIKIKLLYNLDSRKSK